MVEGIYGQLLAGQSGASVYAFSTQSESGRMAVSAGLALGRPDK